jgi:hypothetical protein
MVTRAILLYAVLGAASLAVAWVWGLAGLPPHDPAAFPIEFYQRVVGPVDGRRCPANPVCSRYAREAIAAHGLWIGSWLTLDRLIHEAGDSRDGRWVLVDGERRLDDPLARNDFWLHQ